MLEVPSVNPARPEVFPASKVNRARTVLWVSIVKAKRAIVVLLQIQQNVSNARQAGHRKLAAPSVNPARLELSAVSKVKPAKVVSLVSIVKVKRVMVLIGLQMRVQIQEHALTVQQVGRQKLAVPNVNPARLELSAAS